MKLRKKQEAFAWKKEDIIPFAKKNAKWLALAACIIVALLVFALWPRKSKSTSAAAQYVETVLEKRDITNSISGYGTLKPAQSYSVTSRVGGKVLTADFSEGDIVSEGTVLYNIDSTDAAANLERTQISYEQTERNYQKVVDTQYVKADTDGVVSSISVRKGDSVNAGSVVAVVRDSSVMLLNLNFPAADAAGFTVGQTATVTLDGTFEQLPGTITKVSGTDTVSSGNMLVRAVTISVRNSGGLTTSQAATASVNGINSISGAAFTYNEEKSLTALATGKVAEINVKEGDTVHSKDILVTLEGDSINESLQAASESLRNAELSLKSTQDGMKNYNISSPINGTVVEKKFKPGDYVNGGNEVCVIYDLSYLEMVINVDELNIKLVSVGQNVQVTADAVSGKTYNGVITRVSVAGSTSGGTTTYPVTVRIDETDGLLPGMNANAEIITGEAKDALAVPNAAIVRGSYVLVTSGSPSSVNAVSDLTAPSGYVYVQVQTGISSDDYTQIESGLQEGDTIAYDSSLVSGSYYAY